ncbi:hypothetical protein NEISICOT_01179 [Neisseria sicca ATCC 29256]|uniref:Uncharacterized protein n=1 Tax=Neisseria sicca ATCC 29256 TaxID=547045 RepID=C6M3N1_NEISI|nr:hypothetical protein NEISICOT_01179 [Neisseria sicca ATCC 29256]
MAKQQFRFFKDRRIPAFFAPSPTHHTRKKGRLKRFDVFRRPYGLPLKR